MARKLAVMLLLFATGAAAFATLGEGVRTDRPRNSFLSTKPVTKSGHFSLRSGYTYRGNQILGPNEKQQIRLNSTVTVQKGNTTYIVPIKKKVILENVKITIGNQQFRRN
jgi:hypothetical protein